MFAKCNVEATWYSCDRIVIGQLYLIHLEGRYLFLKMLHAEIYPMYATFALNAPRVFSPQITGAGPVGRVRGGAKFLSLFCVE